MDNDDVEPDDVEPEDVQIDDAEPDEFEAAFATEELETVPPPPPAPATAGIAPNRGWWTLPVIIIAAIVLLGLIGVAIDDPGDDVSATNATTTTTVASTTTSSIAFTTATTALDTTTTSVTPTTASTVATATTAVSNGAAPTIRNEPLSISVAWPTNPTAAGVEIVFDVTVRDPDASPIREGACGNGPTGMAFGDGASYPTSCGASCAGAPTSATRTAGTAQFTYRHTYASPGVYNATVTYASGDRCTSPYASVGHLTFEVTIN